MARAITYTRFGTPDVLHWGDVSSPTPGGGQVLVQVKAASVNPLDAKIRRGEMEQVFPTSLPAIPGTDVAGVVACVGEGMDAVSVGDEVLGTAVGGAYAELALVEQLVPKPEALSWELAAALPLVGEAAVRAMRHLNVGDGQTLLILGAAGSVGALVTQLATARGVTVIGAVDERDDDRLRALGGIPVRYGDGVAGRVREVTRAPVDAVLDAAGHGPIEEMLQLTSSPDRILTLVDFAAVARYGIRGTGGDPSDRVPEALAEVTASAGAGKLGLPIAHSYALADARLAHEDLEAGDARGKLILVTG
jgi:NADPH:quinone reductase-like Zn-dependent oxidoreductase